MVMIKKCKRNEMDDEGGKVMMEIIEKTKWMMRERK
jgi:hypothetical protein